MVSPGPSKVARSVQASCFPLKTGGSVHTPETVWPSASGPRTVPATSNRWRSIAQIGRLACASRDRSLDDADRARRMRDRFGEYDGIFDDDR
jgi:hypothetical protein